MAISKSFLNVILLGFAFMSVFTAFQTMGNIQKAMIDSIHGEDNSFNGDGYTSMAIIYAVFAILNWAAPSIISLLGPKIAMIYGAFTYLLFILTFLIPKTWLLYAASAIMGTGAAMIWTGQGNYLTLNSSPATMSRNSGIFWAMLQASMFIGNLYVFFQFEGKTVIDKDTRSVVIWVLAGIAIVGIGILILLPKARRDDEDSTEELNVKPEGPVQALVGAGKLFFTKRMILLSITFFYTGIELSFYSGVYGPSIGFTKKFGNISTQLIGLSGIFIGLGEVIGGALFGILGAKTTRWGRDPIVMAGFFIHIVAFFLIFLNLPDDAPFGKTHEIGFIAPNAPLAIFCSFLLGFGDACYNTQIYSMLGGVFRENSASAFAVFKFTQSVAAAASFFYSSHLGLYIQLGILLGLAVIGTISFVLVEWEVKREARNKADTASESGASSSSEDSS